jgi:hypothetical protein
MYMVAPSPGPGHGEGGGDDLVDNELEDQCQDCKFYAEVNANGVHGGGGGSGGGFRNSFGVVKLPAKTSTCYSLAAGQSPGESFGSWLRGTIAAGLMTDMFEYGLGPRSFGFGPNSIQANEMMASRLVQQNIRDFLRSGKSWMNGWQNFGLPELAGSGANPTAQFVGSYGWSASLSKGVLTFAVANQTSFDSLFYHVSKLTGGRIPFKWGRSAFPLYGNVNQTIVFRVPCGG